MISEQEYLNLMVDDREKEYIDGELVDRSLPNNTHSETLLGLITAFLRLKERLPLHPRPELRLRVAPGRYRILDLAVYAGEKPTGEVPSEPPLIAVEIVSPDDRYDDLMSRLQQYHDWGVRHVWLVDPQLRRLYVFEREGLLLVPAYELAEYDASIAAEEILS